MSILGQDVRAIKCWFSWFRKDELWTSKNISKPCSQIISARELKIIFSLSWQFLEPKKFMHEKYAVSSVTITSNLLNELQTSTIHLCTKRLNKLFLLNVYITVNAKNHGWYKLFWWTPNWSLKERDCWCWFWEWSWYSNLSGFVLHLWILIQLIICYAVRPYHAHQTTREDVFLISFLGYVILISLHLLVFRYFWKLSRRVWLYYVQH